MDLASHERPLLLVLPPGASSPGAHAAQAISALVAHPEVRAFGLPPLWDLSWGGLDPLGAFPDVPRLDLAVLPRVLAWLAREATPDRRDAAVHRAWTSLPDRVREFHLGRSTFAVLGAIFRLTRSSASTPPPPSFVSDWVHASRFEIVYRLDRLGASRGGPAPAEEASLVFYPYDPTVEDVRRAAGVPDAETGVALEAFAYEEGRERHTRVLRDVARALRGRLEEPPPPEPGPRAARAAKAANAAKPVGAANGTKADDAASPRR